MGAPPVGGPLAGGAEAEPDDAELVAGASILVELTSSMNMATSGSKAAEATRRPAISNGEAA